MSKREPDAIDACMRKCGLCDGAGERQVMWSSVVSRRICCDCNGTGVLPPKQPLPHND